MILSLNSVLANAVRINKLEITSLYVGASRVHNFNELRILPLTEDEITALTEFTVDPLLRTYLQNYDDEGNWKIGGLRHEHKARKQEKKLELGMIDFDSLTKTDCEKFADKLDLHVEYPKTLTRLQDRLRPVHTKAREKLKMDDGRLLKQKQIEFTKQLLKQNLTKMDPETMRYYAKRLGHKGKGQRKKILSSYLKDIIKNTKTQINVEDINNDSDNDEDMQNEDINSNSDNDVFIEMQNDNVDLHITAGVLDYNVDEDFDLRLNQQHLSNQHQYYNTSDVDEDFDLMVNQQHQNYYTHEDEMHDLAA